MAGFRAMPLSLRVPLLAAGGMVVAGTIASQQVLSALGDVQDARLREMARLHVEGLSVALGPHVLRRDVWEVWDTLDRARQAADGQRMRLTVVADPNGRVIAASDPTRAPIDSAIAPLVAGAGTLDSISALGVLGEVRVEAPLRYQGREVGRILTELDVRDLQAERRRALRILIVGNALVTGMLALGVYLAMRRMLRPIAQLAARMGRTGSAPERVPGDRMPKGDGEVARLVQTYNAMSDAIDARAEAERRLAARERFVSLGRLSSSLAHEINNPLGGLLNATDTIRSYADRPAVVRASADLIDRGLRHLRDVARATLDQSRIDRHGLPLSATDLDDLRTLFGPEAARRGLKLDWRVELTLLPRVDAGPVRQIALNLLLNAAAVTPAGGTVGFHAEGNGEGLRLTVRDGGPGLPEEARRRLLTDDTVPPGGGLGLRLVHDLVAGLGGCIETRPQPSGGMIISVTVPEAASC